MAEEKTGKTVITLSGLKALTEATSIGKQVKPVYFVVSDIDLDIYPGIETQLVSYGSAKGYREVFEEAIYSNQGIAYYNGYFYHIRTGKIILRDESFRVIREQNNLFKILPEPAEGYFWHLEDGDAANGKLYVATTELKKDYSRWQRRYILVFDADSLEPVEAIPINENTDASSVAIDPKNNIAYIGGFWSSNVLKYSLPEWKMIREEISNLRYIQGISFYNDTLYISTCLQEKLFYYRNGELKELGISFTSYENEGITFIPKRGTLILLRNEPPGTKLYEIELEKQGVWFQEIISGYIKVNDSTVQFILEVPQSKATHYGKVFGLYLEDGTLFAVAKPPFSFPPLMRQRFRVQFVWEQIDSVMNFKDIPFYEFDQDVVHLDAVSTISLALFDVQEHLTVLEQFKVDYYRFKSLASERFKNHEERISINEFKLQDHELAILDMSASLGNQTLQNSLEIGLLKQYIGG